jgi:hypothetical protein
MLTCEGYKMFKGKMLITPRNLSLLPKVLEGTWLYKPEHNCWYCGGSSFAANICEVKEDWTV